MLDKLRAEALALIAATPACILSTTGPAGVQASVVACLVCESHIYVLVPSTIDHLFNLEHQLEVVLTSLCWQLRGAAVVVSEGGELYGSVPQEIGLRARSTGCTPVEVFPLRIHLEAAGSRRYRETIDFDMRPRLPVRSAQATKSLT